MTTAHHCDIDPTFRAFDTSTVQIAIGVTQSAMGLIQLVFNKRVKKIRVGYILCEL